MKQLFTKQLWHNASLSSFPYHYYSAFARNFFQLWLIAQLQNNIHSQTVIPPGFHAMSSSHRTVLFRGTRAAVGFERGCTQRADPGALSNIPLRLHPAQQRMRSTGRRGQEGGRYIHVHSSRRSVSLHLSAWEEGFSFPSRVFLPTI